MKAVETKWNEEWYQHIFICQNCGCNFMTCLYDVAVAERTPCNYCPNCGIKFDSVDN